MGRTWMFEETGEFRNPQKDEWYSYGMDTKTGGCVVSALAHETPFSILKLTEYPENPMNPIRNVWEKYQKNPLMCNYPEAAELWQAICKAMEEK